MLEKNKFINPNRKSKKVLHGNYARIDPNAEITSAFINQAISQVDGSADGVPHTGEQNVAHTRDWVSESKMKPKPGLSSWTGPVFITGSIPLLCALYTLFPATA